MSFQYKAGDVVRYRDSPIVLCEGLRGITEIISNVKDDKVCFKNDRGYDIPEKLELISREETIEVGDTVEYKNQEKLSHMTEDDVFVVSRIKDGVVWGHSGGLREFIENLVIREKGNKQKPHVHKDLIIAWANGADIQVYTADYGWEDVFCPSWFKNTKYRIVDKAKQQRIQALKDQIQDLQDEIETLES